MTHISEGKEFEKILENEDYLLALFSSEDCSVCHAVFPRIEELTQRLNFPAVHISLTEAPYISGQHNIFSVPAVLIFFHGKEYVRQARFLDFKELEVRMKQMREA